MATLDFSQVNWRFLLAVFLSKSVVFVAVVVVCLLVTRPTDSARAGLYAIFCTQSNDFALGYPIVAALYSHSHPQYPSYLYLLAPISLVILNPIAFFLMELGKRQSAPGQPLAVEPPDQAPKSSSKAQFAFKILTSILFNPVVLMTCLGVCGNLIFKSCLPVILEGILKVL